MARKVLIEGGSEDFKLDELTAADLAAKRRSLAQIQSAAANNELNEGELYLITNTQVPSKTKWLVVGTGADTYEFVGPTYWGDIGGTLSQQTDLQDALTDFGQLDATQTWTGVNTFRAATSGGPVQKWLTADGVRFLDLEAPANGDLNAPFIFNTANSYEFQTDFNAKVTIDPSGKLGVGTTDPTEKLDVNGKIRQRTETVAADDGDIVATKGYVDTAAGIQIDSQPSLYMAEGIVDPRVARAWKRDSEGTRRAQNGLIETVPADTPRLNFNPDGTFDKYLIEPASTNSFPQPMDFSDAAWSKLNATVASATESTPEGSSGTIFIIDSPSAGNTDYIEERINGITDAGQDVAMSCVAKAGTSGKVNMRLIATGGTTQDDIVIFDFASGSFDNPAQSGIQSAEQLANGWWRIKAVLTLNNTGQTNYRMRLSSGGVHDTGTVRLWHAQGEENQSAATSIIKTNSTRAADDVVIDGAHFDALGIKDGGSVVAEYEAVAAGDLSTVYQVTNEAEEAMLRLWTTSTDRWVARYDDSGGDRFQLFDDQGINRAVAAFGENKATTFANGALVADQSVTDDFGPATRMYIGRRVNDEPINGGIRSLIIYPNRLTNAELEAASVVGQKLPGLAETTNRITQQFPHTVEPYTPYAIPDVTGTGQTRTLDVANGTVQTIEATNDFTLNIDGPDRMKADIWLYIVSDVSVEVTGPELMDDLFAAATGTTQTRVFHILWDGKRAWPLQNSTGAGDLRP